jgi:hypothetical protein
MLSVPLQRPNRVVGGLQGKSAARQLGESALPAALVGDLGAASNEHRGRPGDDLLVVLGPERRVDQVLRDSPAGERLPDPVGAPARQLALILGVAAGKALVVDRAVLDQAGQDLDSCVLLDPSLAQPPTQLRFRVLLAPKRLQRQLVGLRDVRRALRQPSSAAWPPAASAPPRPR